jgi:nucleotide-binding universal stress UspA family protein
MFNKILIPLDGSELATCVLPQAVAIAQAMSSEITLLHVLESQADRAGAVNPLDWQLHKFEAQAYLDARGACLGQHMAQPPRIQLLEGRAAERIIECAQREAFDLLVLSSHGQGGLSGSNLSDVAQTVVYRARKSILLVRDYQPCCAQSAGDQPADGAASFRYQRILVVLDGSARAESVLPIASALAQHQAAELLLAHVVTQPEMIQRMPFTPEELAVRDQLIERNHLHATQYFSELQGRLSPTPHLHIQVNHNVATSLHRLVEQVEADLVILCAHGDSGQQQWPYGSVATSFITYGTTSLLIVQDLLPHEIPLSKAERLSEQAQHRPQNWRGKAEMQWMDTNVVI